jgi:hypothetical protein
MNEKRIIRQCYYYDKHTSNFDAHIHIAWRWSACSDLPAGTTGTIRVHPRREAGRADTGTAAGRRARVDGFFF